MARVPTKVGEPSDRLAKGRVLGIVSVRLACRRFIRMSARISCSDMTVIAEAAVDDGEHVLCRRDRMVRQQAPVDRR